MIPILHSKNAKNKFIYLIISVLQIKTLYL
nr:MAG TPA: hypothetical protein [Caudoviricetes sp.]